MNIELSKGIFEMHTAFCSDTGLLEKRSWKVIECGFPVLIVEFSRIGKNSIRIKMLCEEWNDMPPSIQILDNEGNPLTPDNFPIGHGVFNSSLHPKFNRPFICTPGSIEYHEHSSHTSDAWDNYKEQSNFSLGGILDQIWNAWLRTS